MPKSLTTKTKGSRTAPARAHTTAHPLGEEAFRLMVEGVKDYAIFMLDTQGYIATWNAGAQRIKRYTAEEIIGQHMSRFYCESDLVSKKPARELEHAIRTGKYEEEGLRLRKDGSTFWANVLITAVYDGTGTLRGFAKVTRDISERKKAEHALVEAKQNAEHAARVAQDANGAKDHFLAVLSHELRTPLTPILATVTLLERTANLPKELQEEIGIIRRNVELEVTLVNELLDMSRLAQGKTTVEKEATDIHAIIRNALQVVQQNIDAKSQTLVTTLSARRRHVWGDPTRLQQVLVNLIQNASKFTPEGGSITIRSLDEGQLVRLEVTDTGIGIDPAILPRLFVAFEQGERTVTRAYGGLGLGLSIAKSMVDLHDGIITAESEGAGKGATLVEAAGNV